MPVNAGVAESAPQRKARGAFFTPAAVAEFISAWAVREATDRVLEPSAGEAEFLVAATRRLRGLSDDRDHEPAVHGVEIHGYSAQQALERVRAAGGAATVQVADFFTVAPEPTFDAVIGNPPYIRFQDFAGDMRIRARSAALQAGVALSGLSSSWAAFTVHSAQFLRPGGRLGLVLPGELMSVNYAAPVRRYLFDHFSSVELVLFDEQLFPDAETEVVLVLAGGFGHGPADHAVVRTVANAEALADPATRRRWEPRDPADKWTSGLVDSSAVAALARGAEAGDFVPLSTWGETTLGMVTGNNRYFTLAPERACELGLPDDELLPISPPGSAHLRGLELDDSGLEALGQAGKATRLFFPRDCPSPAAQRYLRAGETLDVDTAYKCRVRSPWYRVPLLPPADLLLTCMNADTPRLTTNTAGVRHLNSVHGVYLRSEVSALGRELLPLASLNSMTLLHAELVGRSYGGGILKIEPREADQWIQPSPELVAQCSADLRRVRPAVAASLRVRDLPAAVAAVDEVLFGGDEVLTAGELGAVRHAREAMALRRAVRGRRGR